MKEDIIKKGLSTILTFIEISQIIDEKHIAVKNQDYQLAYDLRCKEVDLKKDLPTIEEIKKLRDSL